MLTEGLVCIVGIYGSVGEHADVVGLAATTQVSYSNPKLQ
jgi:hypothetical protein